MTLKEEIGSLESQVKLLRRDVWVSLFLDLDREGTQKKLKKYEELYTKLLRKQRYDR